MHGSGRAPFEGPEKKLEIVLAAPMRDLRAVEGARWRQVIAVSGADVISQIGNRSVDAYLLSESSLFVWSDRLLLITCGETTPLSALPAVLDFIPADHIGRVFYARKNFIFPQRQESDFEVEVAAIVPYFTGKSFRLGPANGDHRHLFYSTHTDAAFKKSLTFELLMCDLPEAVLDGFRITTASRQFAGLRALCGGMKTDHHFFSPDGYSLNAIRGRRYLTVHVTPQRPGSYASMETNLPPTAIAGMMREMLSLFSPGRFSMVLTTSMDREMRGVHQRLQPAAARYAVSERSRYELDCGAMVSFATYES